MASAWQEPVSQVLGSVSGNLRPEQSFPFGENGIFPLAPPHHTEGPLVRPAGVEGVTAWLYSGPVWDTDKQDETELSAPWSPLCVKGLAQAVLNVTRESSSLNHVGA